MRKTEQVQGSIKKNTKETEFLWVFFVGNESVQHFDPKHRAQILEKKKIIEFLF